MVLAPKRVSRAGFRCGTPECLQHFEEISSDLRPLSLWNPASFAQPLPLLRGFPGIVERDSNRRRGPRQAASRLLARANLIGRWNPEVLSRHNLPKSRTAAQILEEARQLPPSENDWIVQNLFSEEEQRPEEVHLSAGSESRAFCAELGNGQANCEARSIRSLRILKGLLVYPIGFCVIALAWQQL